MIYRYKDQMSKYKCNISFEDENEEIFMSVHKCQCGYYYGIDIDSLFEHGKCEIYCPSCGSLIRFDIEEAAE